MVSDVCAHTFSVCVQDKRERRSEREREKERERERERERESRCMHAKVFWSAEVHLKRCTFFSLRVAARNITSICFKNFLTSLVLVTGLACWL